MNYKRILIAVDGSENSLLVAKKGFELAEKLKAEVGIVFVVDKSKAMGNPDAGIMPDEALILLKKEAIETIDQLISINKAKSVFKFMPEGNPKEDILKTADDWQADLIVIGMRGKSGFALFVMGSIAQHVVLHSAIPVMIIPAKKD